MRRHFPAVLAALACGLAFGCGAAPPALRAPEEEGLPLVFPPAPPRAPEATASFLDGPEPAPPAPGEAMGACPLRWTPRELGASVIHIPPELGSRMMAPFMRALCACTRPGQSLYVVGRLVPDRGEVTAHTSAQPELQARASAGIDACLARELGPGLYEPFHLGGCVVCDPPAVKRESEPGTPAPIWVPRRAGCSGDEDASASLSYPIHVDRRAELPR